MEAKGWDASQNPGSQATDLGAGGHHSHHEESDASSSAEYPTSQDDDQGDEDDEVHLSPLELARACGFCSNFMLEDPLYSQALTVLPLATEHDLDDPEGALSVTDASFDDLFVERLEIPSEAALLFQKIMLPDVNRLPLDGVPEVRVRKKLGMEPPLLRSDHEMDMKRFCHLRRTPLAEVKLPLEHIHTELDEGMEWPLQFVRLPDETMKTLSSERLEVPRETVKYIRGLVKDEAGERGHHQFDEQVKGYVKRSKTQPISPPLLPIISPPLAPFDPSSETGELPLLSDGGDLVAMEAIQLDLQSQAADEIKPSSLGSSDQPDMAEIGGFASIYIPLQQDLSSNTSPPHKRKIRDMAIDVPLIASDASTSSSEKKRKTVAFAEVLCTYRPEPSQTRPLHELRPESEASMDALIKEFIEPVAIEAEKVAQQEQLVAADALQRIPVPVVDFSMPVPPWKSNGVVRSEEARLKNTADTWRDELEVVKASLRTVPGYGSFKISAKEERQLKQYPFDVKLGEVPKELPIEDNRYIAVIMSDMSLEDVITTDTLAWKPEGLRIQQRLRYEVEEELEACGDPQDNLVEDYDLQSLLWKRQQELLQQGGQGSSTDSVSTPSALRSGKSGLHVDAPSLTAVCQSKSNAITAKGVNASLSSGFASARSLHALMVNMGYPHAAKLAHELPRTEMSPPRQSTKAHPTDVTIEETARTKLPKQIAPLDLPNLPAMPPYNTVVLPVSLVHNYRRTLKRVFKDLLPDTLHIERDFSSVPSAPEADILVSPGVGVILTSLQKIKQKPLPGQVGESNSVRERISKLVLRYEMLIVLVGDAFIIEHSPPDQRDGEALADFSAFCAQCGVETQVVPIPAGEESMAVWIASTVCQFGSVGQGQDLLQDETMWEQTLRRLGLNAYAAQVILASLKEEDHSCSSDPALTVVTTAQDHGIRAFISMTAEQRMSKFEGQLGGRNVLHHVNKAIERQWLSEKTGYSVLRA